MSKIRGVRDIPTSIELARSRATSVHQREYEMLSELARLGREKVWLYKEKENWQEKVNQIDGRLRDIKKLEKSLYRQMEDLQTARHAARPERPEIVVKY